MRKIKEEFGIKNDVLDFLVESIYEYDFNTIKLLAYLVKWKSGVMQVKEHSEVKWGSID